MQIHVCPVQVELLEEGIEVNTLILSELPSLELVLRLPRNFTRRVSPLEQGKDIRQ